MDGRINPKAVTRQDIKKTEQAQECHEPVFKSMLF